AFSTGNESRSLPIRRPPKRSIHFARSDFVAEHRGVTKSHRATPGRHRGINPDTDFIGETSHWKPFCLRTHIARRGPGNGEIIPSNARGPRVGGVGGRGQVAGSGGRGDPAPDP